MPGNQKQHRADTEIISNDRIDDIPGTTQVKQQSSCIEYIGKKAIENRGPHDGIIPLYMEDVD